MLYAMPASAAVARIFAAGMLLALGSCGPAATAGGFDSANPAARMYAIEHAARSSNRAAIGRIVEQLDCDDPAVRLMAITTLKRLTGETYGYRDFDPPQVRREAIERWVKAVNADEVPSAQLSTAPPPTPSQTPLGHHADHG